MTLIWKEIYYRYQICQILNKIRKEKKIFVDSADNLYRLSNDNVSVDDLQSHIDRIRKNTNKKIFSLKRQICEIKYNKKVGK